MIGPYASIDNSFRRYGECYTVHPLGGPPMVVFTDPEAIKEGRALFIKSGCSACHGVGGGGGMGPPLLGYKWKFGGDDETLFRLIRGEIPRQTMPAVFGKVLKDEQIWKILAYIRSLYRGDPAEIVWGPPAEGGPKAPAPEVIPRAPPAAADEAK